MKQVVPLFSIDFWLSIWVPFSNYISYRLHAILKNVVIEAQFKHNAYAVLLHVNT